MKNLYETQSVPRHWRGLESGYNGLVYPSSAITNPSYNKYYDITRLKSCNRYKGNQKSN